MVRFRAPISEVNGTGYHVFPCSETSQVLRRSSSRFVWCPIPPRKEQSELFSCDQVPYSWNLILEPWTRQTSFLSLLRSNLRPLDLVRSGPYLVLVEVKHFNIYGIVENPKKGQLETTMCTRIVHPCINESVAGYVFISIELLPIFLKMRFIWYLICQRSNI